MLVRQEEVFMRELRRNGEDGRIMITRVLYGDILKRIMAMEILKLRSESLTEVLGNHRGD